MVKTVKELKRRMDARARADEVERDEEGRAVIGMTVLKDEDFLSAFSAGRQPVVSTEVAEFLDESAKAFLPREPVRINIYSDCIDKEEEKTYSEALKEYYVRHYKENRRELKRNAVVSLLMAVVGLLALTGSLLLSYLLKNAVVSEATDIFAWVFLWEAVDLFFLERMVLRAERDRCLRFIEANICYYPRGAALQTAAPEE